MKSAVIVFPASNCDRDAQMILAATGMNPAMVWHRDTALPKVDLVVLPGGFSYGDYLRSGAMAAHSPILQEVKKHAAAGGKVLGICNGFQILTEAGLLPGVLMRNAGLKFVCKEVCIDVQTTNTPFTRLYKKGQRLNIPVAHHDGNYFADEATLDDMEQNDQIVFRYACDNAWCGPANPNGSIRDIAGICNKGRNVLGMMPHPERHAEAIVGGTDGLGMFKSLLAA